MLRAYYAFFFVAVGISMAFFPPYLRGLGLSGRQVSMMLAVAPTMNLGMPLAWGYLADRLRRPDLVLRLVTFGAVLFLLPLVVVRSMPGLLLCYVGHQSFAVAIVGLCDSIALEQVRRGADYGRIRLWGSLSFAIACLLIGPALAMRHAAHSPIVPALMAGALACALGVSFGVRGEGGERPRPQLGDITALLGDRRFLFLLVISPLHWAANAPYSGFLAILLGDRGLSSALVGLAFTCSVIGELVVLYSFKRLRGARPLSWLLVASFAVSSLRWWGVTRAQSPAALVALQSLHAFTFGLFWGTALAWIGECVPPRLRATGQALFMAATAGVGNIVGMLGSGAIYDATGSATPAFAVAAVLELAPLALTLSWGRRVDPTRAGTRT